MTDVIAALQTDGPWADAVERYIERNPRRLERIDAYRRLLDAGDHRRIAAAVAAGTHRPVPPRPIWRNKADGRKKLVFRFAPPDELLFRTLNRLLQPAAEAAASPWCRSFLPGGGARVAVAGLVDLPDRSGQSAARLDIRDYFNSIDVADLLRRLPPTFADGPIGALLRATLLDVEVPHGVMAGTPLAPLLATLHLADLDLELAATGVTYRRYSDDIVLLGDPAAVAAGHALVRRRLAERGLVVNEEKSSIVGPGEPWDYLGFRFGADGGVGLAPLTSRKFEQKSTRLARGLLRWRETREADVDRTLRAYVRRTNARLYGVPGERATFSWATWFLPVLTGDRDLARLDAHLQREARYAAIGRRTASTRQAVPRDALVAAGLLPLVAAYWARREGVVVYDALVARRTAVSSTPGPGTPPG